EGWVNKLLNSIDNKNVLIIDAGETLELLCESDYCKNKDPHVWLSPKKVLAMTKKIRDQLVKKFQEHGKQIDENYKKIEIELNEIDKNYYNNLSNCKYQKIYVYHKALGYLEKDYKIEQFAIIDNYVPEGEPSMMHLELLSKQMKKENYSHILLEKNVNEKALEFLKDKNIKIHLFDTMEVYYEKDLETNLQSKLLNNLFVLKEALECS
ncbi:MAG: zinc ABC transporter substrate-binding protein, partial [Candidatus Anstonellales archaeon]